MMQSNHGLPSKTGPGNGLHTMTKRMLFFLPLLLLLLGGLPAPANDGEAYSEYAARLGAVHRDSDIAAQGFEIIEEHRYPLPHRELGLLEFIPSIDKRYGRMVLFFKGEDGAILFKTDRLESNSWFAGQMEQPNRGILGVAFPDLNGDGLEDLILICSCVNQEGAYAGKPYPVGEVLFQGERGFYRDWRISDKINRFDMNKDIYAITAFVRDGRSIEFLYTAKTLDELTAGGFEIINAQSLTAYLEKFGLVRVIAGFYALSGQNSLVLYIVNQEGQIMWNFQPMGDYVNFYGMRGISFSDIDGDGLKDVTILADYVRYNEEGQGELTADYNIYYQRTGFFQEDTDFKRGYPCAEEDNLSTVTQNAKRFWGGGHA